MEQTQLRHRKQPRRHGRAGRHRSTATEAEEQAAQIAALGVFERAMAGLRQLFARRDETDFLEQVSRRAGDRSLAVERHAPGEGQARAWVRINLPAEFGTMSSFAIFGPGEWIMTIHVQCSPALELAPEVSIDRSRRAAALLRALLAGGLESTQQ